MVKLVHLLNSPCPPFEGEGGNTSGGEMHQFGTKVCIYLLLRMMILTVAEGRRRYLNGEEKRKKKNF